MPAGGEEQEGIRQMYREMHPNAAAILRPMQLEKLCPVQLKIHNRHIGTHRRTYPIHL
jgi:hypothetical protein